ncbi:DUF5372 family protein [Micromonospora krabiensis]|uniref:DUF5372 family protein n=1 Tax=Micromonospora krabiensis TaxID=307121 RepID=UPI0022B23949|nr:DUF5372 family protein [Micromonospora krabiensis]
MITHPFHPLRGQSLVVLFTQRKRHGLFFVCEVEGRRRITVAQDWTDWGVAAFSDRLAVEGLSAARALIDKIDPVLAVADSHEQAPDGDGCDGGSNWLETGTVERVGHSPGRDGRGEHGRVAAGRGRAR